jgi:hypothetical protein
MIYTLDLSAHDGDDLRNLPFLCRKAALARLLRNTQAALPKIRRVRQCLPAWRRGHRVDEGRWHVSIRPVQRLDQSPQSRKHRRTEKAERHGIGGYGRRRLGNASVPHDSGQPTPPKSLKLPKDSLPSAALISGL